MNPKNITQNRVRWIARVSLLGFALIFGRLIQLQILDHADLLQQARTQQVKTVEVQAPRGTIFDRNGRPLAMSVPVDTVIVNPQRIPDRGVAAEILAKILGLDQDELTRRVETAFKAGRGYLVVKKHVNPEEANRLKHLNLEWVEFRPGARRYYPNGSLAAHVVGSVNHEQEGDAGLEQGLNDELQGHTGVVRMTTDVRRRGFNTEIDSAMMSGQDVRLTIDRRIQHVAERSLAKAVIDHNCKTGSLVVMNPHTGELLAVANYPTFDPNLPVQGPDDMAGRRNLAVVAPFEPGSVFKVFTIAAALETTNLTPDTVINCGRGVINLFGRIIHDHDPYSALSMADVLAKSSNIGAIQVGLRVGEQRLHEYVKRFGFGDQTGLPLPAESSGRVFRLSRWTKSSIGSVAMGHEVLSTTVQLAQGAAVVANGGLLVRPRITVAGPAAGAIRNVALVEDKGQPVRAIKPETAITMRQLMEGVVLRGTGRAARLDGYSSAGKTGSAQIYDEETKHYTHKYNASFMGFAPVANPALVVVVTLNGASKYGGAVAAPVFREVAGAALRILDVPRDLPDQLTPAAEPEQPANDVAIAELGRPMLTEPIGPKPAPPAPDPNAPVLIGPRVPDFSGKTMRAVLEESVALGLKVRFSGKGVARAQDPAAGTVIAAGEPVRVQFAR
ncbi:MAG: PASTA domain-containing protein [Acidobacteria bacterium]|nr:PASTA domain-containing protein [Acidobacteriota bacterium]